MKRLLLLSCCALIGLRAICADAIVINQKPTGATVYLQGASISREVDISVQAGINKFIFIGLPQIALDDRIYASIVGVGKIISMQTSVKSDVEVEVNRILKKMNDSMHVLDKQNALLEKEKSVYNIEVELLRANMNLKGSTNGITAAEIEKAAILYRTRLLEINVLLTEIESKIEKNTEIRNEIYDRYNAKSSEFAALNKNVQVDIKSDYAGTAKLKLFYFIQNASWRPSYNLRFNGPDKDLQIEMLGNLQNYTGENWSNIKVTLSTADPQRQLMMNAFSPWYLGYEVVLQKTEYFKNKQAAPQANGYGNVYSNGAPAMDSERGAELKFGNDNGSLDAMLVSNVATTYELTDKVTLTKDNPSSVFEISSQNTPATYLHKCHIFECNDVYLLARITNWEKLNLQYGTANIFNYGELVGNTEINPFRVSDTMEIALGVDKRVVVKKKKVKDFIEKEKRGKEIEHEFAYEVFFKNAFNQEINLEIIEQIPITKYPDEIKVKLNNESNGEYEAAIGKLSWKMHIKPLEGAIKKFGFSVTYLKEKPINLMRYRTM